MKRIYTANTSNALTALVFAINQACKLIKNPKYLVTSDTNQDKRLNKIQPRKWPLDAPRAPLSTLHCKKKHRLSIIEQHSGSTYIYYIYVYRPLHAGLLLLHLIFVVNGRRNSCERGRSCAECSSRRLSGDCKIEGVATALPCASARGPLVEIFGASDEPPAGKRTCGWQFQGLARENFEFQWEKWL